MPDLKNVWFVLSMKHFLKKEINLSAKYMKRLIIATFTLPLIQYNVYNAWANSTYRTTNAFKQAQFQAVWFMKIRTSVRSANLGESWTSKKLCVYKKHSKTQPPIAFKLKSVNSSAFIAKMVISYKMMVPVPL